MKSKKKNAFVISNNFAILYTSNNEPFIIDIDDLEKVSKVCWSRGNKTYGYPVGWYKGKLIRLNRFIMNCPEGMIVDHMNHNCLDNRKSNLRIVTKQQNSINKRVLEANSSGYTGVVWDKSRNKWQARIRYNGKHIFLGRYDNIEDAVSARVEAEKQYFKQYSYSESIRLSNPDEEKKTQSEEQSIPYEYEPYEYDDRYYSGLIDD